MVADRAAGRCGRPALRPALAAFLLFTGSFAGSAEVANLTGLPLYPNLSKGAMDDAAKTDALGHWCTRFAAETTSSLDAVEAWYRKALIGASETDLVHDAAYRNQPRLIGIKLAMNRDYVTVFKASNQSPTSIELFACTPRH